VNGKRVFNGYANDSDKFSPIIPYKERNLRFTFAAVFYQAEDKTEYQYRLDGYDKDWSDWTKESRKDYTNLDSGLHTFRVRARNVYKSIGTEDTFRFKILPPWYKTWWAFSTYGMLTFILVFLIVRWRSWKLEQEKRHLEKIVKQRTHEIEEKNIQLEDQSEKLKEMDKVKSRFFANISHEFRTPLTLIMGPLDQMLSEPRSFGLNRNGEKKLTLMQRNSQRLLGLINQLLDLSKFDSGKMKLQAALHDIVPFVKGMTASFEIAAEQHELDLTFNTQQESITFYFDREMMEKVMANLLSNAVKFTPPGGKITVGVDKIPASIDRFHAGAVEISVCDTGIGIPKSELPYIFDHFYQVDPSRTHGHKDKGSGIGLALTVELVNLHHGEIDVTSSDEGEKGTRFLVRLPLGKEHLQPGEIAAGFEPAIEPGKNGSAAAHYIEEAGAAIREPGPGQVNDIGENQIQEKHIILIVEDSADVRDYIKSALEPLYTVVEAENGKEGIDKALTVIPDLIISDIMMPEKDGCQLCRELKKDRTTSHIPVILLTAKASEENVLEGLETGADDYITKPFNTRMLSARIKNLIELRSQLHMNMDREMTLKPAEISVSNIDKEFINELKEVINANLSDPEFNVEDMAKKLFLSHTTLYRKINALSGKSPTEFIRAYRLKRGARLLKENFGSVIEVALEVGFSSASYFTKCFKEKFHQLPSEYQASHNS
jgi:signal transduction histidine kinase/DNA-binding response OmpR family regulator